MVMNKRNKDILILAVGLIALFLIIMVSSLISPKTSVKEAKITTDKNEYPIEAVLKVKIENDLKTDICFSSCYPYYFERKDEAGKNYQYINCPDEDLAEECTNSSQIKAFELTVPPIEKGVYRLAIPACVGCNLYDKFRKDQWFYSNEFTIK